MLILWPLQGSLKLLEIINQTKCMLYFQRSHLLIKAMLKGNGQDSLKTLRQYPFQAIKGFYPEIQKSHESQFTLKKLRILRS